MTTNPPSSAAIFDDAGCVRLSLAGNRQAFEKIVAQYQSLICSLIYSATGSLRESEDMAQETFLIAWRRLKELREAEKLRPWLCGIARHLIRNSLRRQEREPTHGAGSLEDVRSVRAPGASPSEAAVNSEEAAILWRSLERIPALYREPLILFYREHHSTERVAAALDLSEETVRQRLSRGRKLLQEEVAAFVEGALQRSAPGLPFTAGVLSALPVAATSAGATALATAAKGGGVLKAAAVGGWSALLASGFVSARSVADDAKSPRERRFVFSLTGLLFGLIFLYLAVVFAVVKFAFPHAPFGPNSRLTAGYLRPNIWLAIANYLLCVLIVGLNLHRSRRQQQIQIQEKTFDERDWRLPLGETNSTVDLSGTRLNGGLKAAKLMAPVGVIAVATLFQLLPWKLRFGRAMVISAMAALILFLFWRLAAYGMQHRPRFIGWTGRQFVPLVGLSILIGSLTLYSFNHDQRTALAYPGVFRAATPAEVSTFNLVVVLAYVLVIGGILWLRKRHAAESIPHP
jgi:RNA polymerase sigma factor (sigma-70 family)